MKSIRINPPFYFAILIVAAIGMHFIIDINRMIYPPYSYGGYVLVFSGSLITLWADYLFKKSGTTVKPYERPCSLNTSGPFRISRNPMYLGFTFILLGVAVFMGILLMIIFPLIFVVICELVYIPVEEKCLEDVFGSNYTEYKRRVRRWL